MSYLSAQAVEFAGAMTTGTSFNTNNFVHASAGAARTAGSAALAVGGAALSAAGLSSAAKARKAQRQQAETINNIAKAVGAETSAKKSNRSSWWNKYY